MNPQIMFLSCSEVYFRSSYTVSIKKCLSILKYFRVVFATVANAECKNDYCIIL